MVYSQITFIQYYSLTYCNNVAHALCSMKEYDPTFVFVLPLSACNNPRLVPSWDKYI